MAIILRLDRVMADKRWNSNRLIAETGLSPVTVSKLKTGRARAIKFSTLDILCKAMERQPGDFLEFMDDDRAIKEGLVRVEDHPDDID